MQEQNQRISHSSFRKSGFWDFSKSKSSASNNSTSGSRTNSTSSDDSSKENINKNPQIQKYNITKKLNRSCTNLEESSNLPFSLEQKNKFIRIISSEYYENKFTKCMEVSGGIIYVDNKTGHQIFAIENKADINNPLEFYFLDSSDLIGEGAQSNVYSAYNLKTHEKVAAKISKNKNCLEDFRKEAENLKKLKRLHGSVIFFTNAARGNNLKAVKTHLILMDYYPGIDLTKFLYKIDISYDKDSTRYFSEKKQLHILMKLKIIKFILEEIFKLHSAKLLHRDIKSENIQINYINQDKFNLYMVDFGSAIEETEKNNDYIGTLGYMAPEISAGSSEQAYYSQEADFFSLGILIAEILTQYSFQGKVRELCKEFTVSGFLEKIPLSQIYSSMPDIFSLHQKSEAKLKINMSEFEMDDFVFLKLQALAISLSHEDPKKRLENSSLQEKISELEMLTEYIEQRKAFAEKQKEFDKLKKESDTIEQKMNDLAFRLKANVATPVVLDNYKHRKHHHTKDHSIKMTKNRTENFSFFNTSRNLIFSITTPRVNEEKSKALTVMENECPSGKSVEEQNHLFNIV